MLPGDGRSGGTDWRGMDVGQMWQAIANQDTTAHYRVLTGWRRSFELTLQHLAQVRNYRESLAAVWPPERSAAAGAYLGRLDDLIGSLQATYDAAVANHDAFAGATSAIGTARDQVKGIYEEYTANQAALAAFAARPRPISRSPVPPPRPPVPDGRQEELTDQARSIMFGLSGEIIQATSQIVKPAVYVPGLPRADGAEGSDGATYAAPPVPPVTTYDPTSSPLRGRGTGPHATAVELTQPSTKSDMSTRTAQHPGLVLGNAQSRPNAASALRPYEASLAPIGVDSTPSVPPAPPIVVRPGGFSATRISRAIGSNADVSRGIPPAVGVSKGFVSGGLIRSGLGSLPPEGDIRAMPPGAVIGGPPATGQSQPATRTRSPSRVNPVGGVIGASDSPDTPRPTVRSSTFAQPVGNLLGHADRRDGAEEPQRWDPDNPWETEEGVPPILLPAEPQRIDPGPAIGLQ